MQSRIAERAREHEQLSAIRVRAGSNLQDFPSFSGKLRVDCDGGDLDGVFSLEIEEHPVVAQRRRNSVRGGLSCHEHGVPKLIEDGMTVTHQIERVSESAISAHGWDGSSSEVSEEGERLLLECPHCFQ